MTYKDLKINILLRLGEDKNIASDGTITETSSITSYLKALPDLLREALNILATAGKYVVKYVEIEQTAEEEGINRYDLKELAADFYSLQARQVYFDDGEINAICSNYRLEGNRYFVVDGSDVGTWRIYYNSYPQTVESNISDTTVIDVDPEVYAILPLYIEGKLRMIADEDYAFNVLNEFEARRAELIARNPNHSISAKVTVPVELEGFRW